MLVANAVTRLPSASVFHSLAVGLADGPSYRKPRPRCPTSAPEMTSFVCAFTRGVPPRPWTSLGPDPNRARPLALLVVVRVVDHEQPHGANLLAG